VPRVEIATGLDEQGLIDPQPPHVLCERLEGLVEHEAVSSRLVCTQTTPGMVRRGLSDGAPHDVPPLAESSPVLVNGDVG
jgi:hypothetical protein